MDTPIPDDPDHERMRARLAAGAWVAAIRAAPPPGVVLRSDEQLEQSREEALRPLADGEDLHVFGYGSLMWNPALEAAQAWIATVHGWHRRYCLRMLFARGTPETPGAMLALDRGGACTGLLYRIAAPHVAAESRLLWLREMRAGSYEARWVQARLGDRRIRALTFVADRTHARYLAPGAQDDVVRLIRTGHGTTGSTRAYFDAMHDALDRLAIRDRGMRRLLAAVHLADLADADAVAVAAGAVTAYS